ncbi:MAG: type II toxin-antitoxin system VapC family toxin [Thiobacillaceae bacterium]|nr:type II toxin-antitoxin system VapC family toxin [Thiobacillaceae bacterium]
MDGLAVIVLDTHVLVWWVSGLTQALSPTALQAVEKELQGGGRILVSCITAWEIAMLVAKGRLVLSMDVATWLATVGELEPVRFVPVDNEIAVKSVELPGSMPKDPADRIIVATARKYGAPLVTQDAALLAYPHVRTIA